MISYEKYLIAVDIGALKLSVSIGDFSANIIENNVFKTPLTYEALKSRVFHYIEEYLKTYKVEAIGIVCSGLVDTDEGIIISPPNIPWLSNSPICKDFYEKFYIPTFLENDANACAYAEWKWGNGKNHNNIIFVMFGSGLGAGLILNGKIYRGAKGLSGEIGHIRLNDEGPYCYKKHGSFESFCSGVGIAKMYSQKYTNKLTAREISNRAKEGDPKALDIIFESATYLGKGLAMLVDFLNPECIIISNIYTRSEELFKDRVLQMIKREALEESTKDLLVLPSALKETLGDKSALGVALNGLFSKVKLK